MNKFNNLCNSVVRKLFLSNKMLIKFGARKSLQEVFLNFLENSS